MTTGDELRPVLRTRLAAALQRRKPRDNVKGWRHKAADDIGVSLSTFDHWLYGPTPSNPDSSLPSLENWGALILAFPGIDAEVFGGILGPNGEAVDLRRAFDDLRDAVDRLEAEVGRANNVTELRVRRERVG